MWWVGLPLSHLIVGDRGRDGPVLLLQLQLAARPLPPLLFLLPLLLLLRMLRIVLLIPPLAVGEVRVV
jgi:hypothetical protein